MDNFCFGDQGADAHSVTSRKSLICKGLHIEVRIMPIMSNRANRDHSAVISPFLWVTLWISCVEPVNNLCITFKCEQFSFTPPRGGGPAGGLRLHDPTGTL